jgi:hypothetical protein
MAHELSLPQRAAVALGTAEHEKELIALAKQSTDIVAVSNAAGRDQAHRVGMTLRTARVNITKAGKEARDDATAFSKAVIAEEKRLIGIVEPEETRIIGLRDAFDAEEQARKDALIAAERARVDGIKEKIQSIRNLALSSVWKPSDIIKSVMEDLDDRTIHEDEFAEFVKDAADAAYETLDALAALYKSAFDAEAEAMRIKQEREAAEDQAKKERDELAQQQAQLKRDQEAAAAELQKQRGQIEDERVEAARLAKIESDRVDAIRRAEDEKRAIEQQKERDRLAAENESLRQQREALEAQQAALIAVSVPASIEDHVHIAPLESALTTAPDGFYAGSPFTAPEYRPSPDEIVQILMEALDESKDNVLDLLVNVNWSEVEL